MEAMTNATGRQAQARPHSRHHHFHKTVAFPRAGLTLGILALGNLLISMTPDAADLPIRIVFGVVALLLYVNIILKFLIQPYTVLTEDMQNPVVAPVSATIFMTGMQFATYLAPAGGFWATCALLLWYASVSFNLVLMVHIASHFVVKGFELKNVYPTWFVGFVGIVVASATAAPLGQQELGRIIFWIGFALYMAMLVLVTVRMARIPLPEAAKPTFTIYTAPMSLSIAGYVTSFDHPNVWFVLVMLVAAQLLFVVVLTQMPRLLRIKFYPSYAAFTFPFVITATALLKAIGVFEAAGWHVPVWLRWLQVAETVAACAIVLYVTVHFVIHIARNWNKTEQMVAEEKAALEAEMDGEAKPVA